MRKNFLGHLVFVFPAVLVTISLLSDSKVDGNTAPPGSDPCPHTICGHSSPCGGQGGTFEPPGPLSMCSQSQNGQACDYCTGVSSIRVCASMGQGGRKCILVGEDKRTKCGNPKKGKCTKKTVSSFTFYYCKAISGGGNGSASCESHGECTKDEPCPE